MTVEISKRCSVVIPAELRRKYNLAPGTKVEVVDDGGVRALVPSLARPIEQAAGMLKGEGSLTRAVLAERRAERRREKLRAS